MPMANAPTLADALAQLEAAAADCQSVVRAIRQLPGHAQQPFTPPLQQLAADLYSLEVALAQVASHALGRPLPSPHPEHAGTWAAAVVRNVSGWREAAQRVPVNPAAFTAAQAIRQRAQAIGRTMAGASGHSAGTHLSSAVGGVPVGPGGWSSPATSAMPMPPVPAPMVTATPRALPPVELMGAGLVAPQVAQALGVGVASMGIAQSVPQSPTPAVPSDFGRRVGGFALSLASLIGTAVAARYAYKHENGQVAPETQETERVKSQQVLDAEAPGHKLDLLPTPGGGWIASVKNGKRSVARATATDPTEAMRQVLTDTIRRDTLGMELGGPGVEVVKGDGGAAGTGALDPSGPARPDAPVKRKRKRAEAGEGTESGASSQDAPTQDAAPAA